MSQDIYVYIKYVFNELMTDLAENIALKIPPLINISNGNTKQRRGAFLTFAALRESVVVFASVLREGAINICRGRGQLIIPCLPRYYLLPDGGGMF